ARLRSRDPGRWTHQRAARLHRGRTVRPAPAGGRAGPGGALAGLPAGGHLDDGRGLMRTVDERLVAADADRVFQAASDVERWPAILPHYRYVRMVERREAGGVVEMSAHRPFG